MINWHLSKQGICWPVSRDYIAGSSAQLIEVTCFFEVDRWPSAGFSIGSRAHVRLTCWKQGRILRMPVNASPGLKFIRIITFSSIQMFFAALFWVHGDYKTQNRKSNSKQKTSPQSYKTQISILPFPRLAQSGTEQPGQGATLLGWPKSIYYHDLQKRRAYAWFLGPFYFYCSLVFYNIILGAFLIKQLFHSCLLDMRWL